MSALLQRRGALARQRDADRGLPRPRVGRREPARSGRAARCRRRALDLVHTLSLRTERHSQLVDITARSRRRSPAAGFRGARLRAPHDRRGDDQRAHRPGAARRRRGCARADRRRRLALAPRRQGRAERRRPTFARRSWGRRWSSRCDDGGLALGTYQGIFFCEFDGPRERSVHVSVLASSDLRRGRARGYAGCGGRRTRLEGEELELRVDSLAYGGNGVARHNGFVVFVRGGLPGDRRPGKRHEGEARLRRGDRRRGPRAERGPRRGAVPPLRHVRRLPLPGLRLRRARSQRRRRRCVTRSCDSAVRRPPARADRPGRVAVSTTATSSSTRSHRPRTGPALGFHRAGRWDEVLAIEECLLTTDLGNAIRDAVRDWAREEDSSRTTRRRGRATSVTSSSARGATRARRSSCS